MSPWCWSSAALGAVVSNEVEAEVVKGDEIETKKTANKLKQDKKGKVEKKKRKVVDKEDTEEAKGGSDNKPPPNIKRSDGLFPCHEFDTLGTVENSSLELCITSYNLHHHVARILV